MAYRVGFDTEGYTGNKDAEFIGMLHGLAWDYQREDAAANRLAFIVGNPSDIKETAKGNCVSLFDEAQNSYHREPCRVKGGKGITTDLSWVFERAEQGGITRLPWTLFGANKRFVNCYVLIKKVA